MGRAKKEVDKVKNKMLNLNTYFYELPKHLIAQSAMHPRDYCKLMVLKNNAKNGNSQIIHDNFYNILNYLQPNDVLILNETKVAPAKLIGSKATGGKVEVILTKKISKNKELYEARIKGNRLKQNILLNFRHNQAEIIKQIDDKFYLRFRKTLNKEDLIVPTPPYIKRKVPEKDYQTVFAAPDASASLAAPTAGLHFTPCLLKKIQKAGIQIAKIQLHIGFGTFLPIRDVQHPMTEPEFFEIGKEAAEMINDAQKTKSLIAVGTTVVKALESAKRKNGKIIPTKAYSGIFIAPGHQFKTDIKAMITNFHLPSSSLLLLAAAYAGRERLLGAYRMAIKHNYRFYSLGDAMMVFKR